MNEKHSNLGETETGIKANVAALLSYLLGFVTGIIFVLIERKNQYVRFHAIQSIAAFGAIFVVKWVTQFIPYVGDLLSGLVLLAGVVVWVILMVKSYQGERFKLPVTGDLAEKYSQAK